MTPGEKRALVVLVLAAFALRALLLVVLGGHRIEDDWAFGYETGRIARSLAEGEGFGSPFRAPSGPTAWLMPAYPALLALFFELFGVYTTASAVAILLFNSLCSALTCWAVFLLAREPLGRPTAWVAAAAMAVYPPAIWHSVNTIWDTSLLALLTVVLVLALYRLQGGMSMAKATGFGLLLGGVVWVNPVVLVIVPLAWLRIWRTSTASTRRRLAAAALLTATTVGVVSPWLIRNHLRFGRAYLRSNLGLELKLGNSDAVWRDHQEGRHSSPWFLGHPSVVAEELDRFVALGESNYVQEAMDDALAYLRQHPIRAARLGLRRMYVFWLSDLGARNEWRGNLDLELSLSWMRKACHLLPLPFLLLGLGVALKRGRDVGPMAGLLLLFPLIYYLTHVSERYRYPVEPFIVILSTYGFLWVLERLGPSGTRPLTAPPEPGATAP